MSGAVWRGIKVMVPPLVLLVAVVIAWEGAVRGWGLKPYVLPSPLAVGRAFWTDADRLRHATLFTGAAAASGFGLSLLVGTVVAFAFSQSKILRTSGYPYAIFLQTVPIVAIAPLIIRWFGYGFQSVVIVAFVLSLFPIITNATAGLLAIDPDYVDLFRLNNASRWQVLWKLRFPSAVPALCTGAKTACGLAVVGAIVGEFFAGYGSQRFGLGYVIQITTERLQNAELFAAIMLSTWLGVVMFVLVSLVSAAILSRWYDAPIDHQR